MYKEENSGYVTVCLQELDKIKLPAQVICAQPHPTLEEAITCHVRNEDSHKFIAEAAKKAGAKIRFFIVRVVGSLEEIETGHEVDYNAK